MCVSVLTHTSPCPPPDAGLALVAAAVVARVAGAGEAAAVASGFLWERGFFGDGDAAGDSAVEGDAAFSAGEAVAPAFWCVRCFAVEGDAAGDSPGVGD
jgi:hypothetical protein